MPPLHKNTPGLKSRFQPDLGPLQRLPYTLFGVYLPKAQGQGWVCTVTCSFPHIRLTNTIRWGIYRWGMTSTRYSFVLSRDERTIMPRNVNMAISPSLLGSTPTGNVSDSGEGTTTDWKQTAQGPGSLTLPFTLLFIEYGAYSRFFTCKTRLGAGLRPPVTI